MFLHREEVEKMERKGTLSWDEDVAREAVRDFHGLLGELEKRHPEFVNRLRKSWRKYYVRCGHKRLGRIMLGYSPDDACGKRSTAT